MATRQTGTLARFMMAPSVILLLIWMVVPLAMTLWFSFQDYNLLNPAQTGFAGLFNYRFFYSDPAFFQSIWNTLVIVVGVLLITVIGGIGLALLIAIMFSVATVITRRFAHVRMTPATCLGTILAAAFATSQASTFAVSAHDMGFLFAFGVVNLGLGLAFFATGARLVPAALAALLGTFEPILGPIWVWLVHSEVPSTRTIIGGAIVITALLVHLALEFSRQARPARPGTTGMPSPN